MTLSPSKVRDFINELDTNQTLRNDYTANPDKTLERETSEDPKNDVWAYRIVVGALSLVVLSIVIGVLINVEKLQAADKVITIIASLGSAAIGALAGLLAPSPVRQSN